MVIPADGHISENRGRVVVLHPGSSIKQARHQQVNYRHNDRKSQHPRLKIHSVLLGLVQVPLSKSENQRLRSCMIGWFWVSTSSKWKPNKVLTVTHDKVKQKGRHTRSHQVLFHSSSTILYGSQEADRHPRIYSLTLTAQSAFEPQESHLVHVFREVVNAKRTTSSAGDADSPGQSVNG